MTRNKEVDKILSRLETSELCKIYASLIGMEDCDFEGMDDDLLDLYNAVSKNAFPNLGVQQVAMMQIIKRELEERNL